MKAHTGRTEQGPGPGRSPAGNVTPRVIGLLVAAGLLAVLLAPAAQALSSPDSPAETADPSACVGSISEPANGTTLVSVQGAKGGDKTPARVVAIGPEGSIQWVHHSGRADTVDAGNIVWSYDVDPLPSGEIFVTATIPGDTVLYAFDPRSGEVTWQVHRPALDTHDADVLPNGRIAVANMRNYDESAGENRDRVSVLDRERNRSVWEWHFADHFERAVGGEYTDDWTHVNDVDRVGPDRFLLSPRNLDQVLLVDRQSGDIVWRLGENGNHSILRKQHNPDYLSGGNGGETVLVADSENDRIVEYARHHDTDRDDAVWNRTWRLSGDFQWPRDADRLPNGNTLVTDSRNHRVLEVAPNGTVVWEVYTPWLPYDAERIGTGDGSNGPTALDQGATAEATLRGADGGHEDDEPLAACAAAYRNAPGPGAVEWTPAPGPGGPASATAGESARRAAGTAEPPAAGSRPANSETATSAVGVGMTPLSAVLALSLGWLLLAARRLD